jgi:hypothetical protein
LATELATSCLFLKLVLVLDGVASGSNELEGAEDGSAEEGRTMETSPPLEGVGGGVVLGALVGDWLEEVVDGQ